MNLRNVVIGLILLLSISVQFLKVFSTESEGKAYSYKIINVIDGDTLTIEAPFLPEELGKTLRLRIMYVDTPEKGGLAKCEREMDKSAVAKEFVEKQINNAKVVKITLSKWDKYGGRVLGDVILDDKKLSDILIKEGHAVTYNGKRKVKNWCN
jgi:endonuclease YncB( thermonuclease family)